MIIDIIFAIGTSFFLLSTIPQVLKLYRVQYSDAQSLVHNEIQIIAMVVLMTGYCLAAAFISFTVTGVQLVIRLHLINLIRQKRRIKLKHKSDLVYYIKKFGGKWYAKIISRTST